MRILKIVMVAVIIVISSIGVHAQKTKDVYVDKSGVMRWGDSKQEVYGFGINYTAPFAHAYRSAKKLGVNLEKAIDDDVYHFSRLGFDAFRVHVWDTEISDSLGNLLDNDHLKLFDYMLWKMKARGMKIFLTPIAFWGNGYPERDDKTPGFASKYGKDACLVNEDAIRAQEQYMYQFLNHVNPYTKLAYKNDPDIVGFEVSNEPHHRGTPESVTRYIKRMIASMQKTGSKKPVFYNISHSVHLGNAYFDAGIQGGTFQWYPTGLGAHHELRGNFLPNVDQYTIPFAGQEKFKSIARIVYEFDAADVGRSYIYPAMARSFREAGIQWATHFAYDPTFLAYANTEYNTHYMNLVYAPQKALSLKIASEVFHRVPRYKNFGRYPANTSFDAFHVSYEQDLAEMVTNEKFIYTNTTTSAPAQPEKLESISGYGNSPLVKYEGKGAYFLDKVQPGVWRLEVLPDAIWVDNVFGRNSLKKTVAVINWRTWPMKINLPDLGDDFAVVRISESKTETKTDGITFDASPGVFVLTRKNVNYKGTSEAQWKNIRLNEYAAPKTTLNRVYVLHHAFPEINADQDVEIAAEIITRGPAEKVMVHANTPSGRKSVQMERVEGYKYRAVIPAEIIKPGYLNYSITVQAEGVTRTFPSGNEGSPWDWDFFDLETYTSAIKTKDQPLYIFNAAADADEVSKEWRRGSKLVPGNAGLASMDVLIEKLFTVDPENPNAKPVYDYALRYNFRDKVKGRRQSLAAFTTLVLRGEAVGRALSMQVALIDKSGNAFGATFTLNENKDYAIALSSFKSVKPVLLPRPYPTFLPYYFDASGGSLNLFDIETVQLSIGQGLDDKDAPFEFKIESIMLNNK